MRERAGELLPKENLTTEWGPLTVQHKDGGEEVKHVPISYVPHLWQKSETCLSRTEGTREFYT